MKKAKDSGITLIALVVTIIVLMILAAVSLSMLTGEGGIIKQARDAKEQSEIDSEKEILELATVKAIGGNKNGNIVFEEFDKAMESYVDKSKYTLEKLENEVIKVTFTESGRYYYVSADGNVTLAGTGPGTGGSGTGEGGSGTGPGTGDNPPTGTPGTRYDEETKVTIDDKPVTIPGGGTLSGVDGETSIEDGLVMYIIPPTDIIPDWNNAAEVEYAQKTYSQFVWVPVENAVLDLSNKTDSLVSDETIKAAVNLEIARGKYPMAIKNTDGNYMGVLYQFSKSTTEDKVVVEISDGWTPLGNSRREPAYLTSPNVADATSYNNVGITKDSLQTEFNTMIKKVSTNGGFWVGRYETSSMNASSDEVKIGVIKGTTTGISNINWYRMYQQQKDYKDKANITLTSSMIWGSQWDQIMIWMRNVENKSQGSYYVVNSIGMGNYGTISGINDGYSDTSNPAPTGCYAVRNIYDLAGNIYNCTLEADSTDHRIPRGGYYAESSTTYTYASYRGYIYPMSKNKYYGSRISLY